MKIAVSGKGGVGKTTIVASIALTLAKKGYKVIAVDADPSPNLALALGITPEEYAKLKPIALNKDLIREKTGVEPEVYGAYFRLSFNVDDIVDRFTIIGPYNIKLLIMGKAENAGEGCMCPAHAVLRALMKHLVVEREEIIVMDMEAGVEHLKRGTTKYVDAMLVVTEPYKASITVAQHIVELSKQLEMQNIFLVGNKIKSKNEELLLLKEAERLKLEVLGFIPYDRELEQTSKLGLPITTLSPKALMITNIERLIEILKNRLKVTRQSHLS